MAKKQDIILQGLEQDIDEKGIDEVLCGSEFEYIKSKKFHELRKQYLKAVRDMKKFLSK